MKKSKGACIVAAVAWLCVLLLSVWNIYEGIVAGNNVVLYIIVGCISLGSSIYYFIRSMKAPK